MKKIAILLLSFERAELLARTLANNIDKAGCPVDVFALDQGSKNPEVRRILHSYCKEVYVAVDNVGIGAGLNYLMKQAYDQGYDYFQTMANDILEDYGWITAKVKAIDDFVYGVAGMVSIYPGEGIPYVMKTYGTYGPTVECHPGDVIGQFMVNRYTVENVGYFNTFGELYAPVDNDYNVRCKAKGLINFYLPHRRSWHLDHGDSIYGYDKGEKIKQTWPQHEQNARRYDKGNSYLPYPDGEYNINMAEM